MRKLSYSVNGTTVNTLAEVKAIGLPYETQLINIESPAAGNASRYKKIRKYFAEKRGE